MADDHKLPSLPEGVKLPAGMTREELERDIAHPEAARQIPILFAQDGPGSVQAGDPAPDFHLPRLGGPAAGERVRLADHFAPEGAGRPVALVFGSYT